MSDFTYHLTATWPAPVVQLASALYSTAKTAACLVNLGAVAVLAIGEQLLSKHPDTTYRVRLIRLLGENGLNHRQAMMPLLLLPLATPPACKPEGSERRLWRQPCHRW